MHRLTNKQKHTHTSRLPLPSKASEGLTKCEATPRKKTSFIFSFSLKDGNVFPNLTFPDTEFNKVRIKHEREIDRERDFVVRVNNKKELKVAN